MMDLIDRKIALEILKELHGEQVMSKYFTQEQCQRTRNGILMAYNEIHSMPTVEAEPVRHGKWITKDVGFLQESFVCSVCGGWEHNLECEHEDLNYCPHCGAKMED